MADASSPSNSPRVLIADDQADVLEAIRLLLKGAGYQVVLARSVPQILEVLRTQQIDAALLDLNYTRDTTSGQEGLDLLRRLQQTDPHVPIVVMTAWGTVEGAVACVRQGARDYITKPWDNDRLLSTLGTHIELSRALRRAQTLEDENRQLRRSATPELIGSSSPPMRRVLSLLERVAPSNAHVLIRGEHGTGKDVIARWLHASSPRAGRPFIAVNAGALSDGVFESELFGHVRGAFTDARSDRLGCFEIAHGGTLFLDEIGTMPPGQQSKLLRVLQTGEFQPVGSSKPRLVDVRVVSATNADLARQVASGLFREDLLYRLNTVEVCLPPLRERREDILILATGFLENQARRYGKPLAGFSEGAAQALLGHSWPGNVRELEHVIERAVLLAQGERVSAEDLVLTARTAGVRALEDMTLDEAEDQLIQRALDRAAGDVNEAARRLGLSRSTLYRRMHRFRGGG